MKQHNSQKQPCHDGPHKKGNPSAYNKNPQSGGAKKKSGGGTVKNIS